MAFNLDLTDIKGYIANKEDILVSKVVTGTETAKMFNVQNGITTDTAIHGLITSLSIQDGANCGFNANGSQKITQRVLEPAYMKVNTQYCPKDFYGTYKHYETKVAMGKSPLPLEEALVEDIVKSIAVENERLLWSGKKSAGDLVDGLTTIIASDSAIPSANKFTSSETSALKRLNEIYVKGKRLYDRLKSKYPDERFIYAYNRIEDYKVNVNGSVLICENGGLNKAKDSNIYSDVYLNVTNSRALALLSSLGVKRIGISLEISKVSLELMIENYKKNYYTTPNLEMIVYGYNDLMISKYCPISKVNKNYKKHCMECHLHKYELEDRMNVKFPLYGDENCIMHILNSRRLHLLEYLKEIKQLVGNVRLDFTIETKDEVEEIVTRRIILEPL
jgi:hypothetical protein